MCIRCCYLSSVQFSLSVLSICNSADCMPGFPVHHKLLKLAKTHVRCVSDAMQLSGEFVISSVLSRCIKNLKKTYGPVLQLSFIWQAKISTSLRHEVRPTGKTRREERTLAQFWLLFLCVFLLPLSLPCVNWASQEGCLFHLRFLLQSSDLPLFYFCGLLPSLSFSHHHSGLLFLF